MSLKFYLSVLLLVCLATAQSQSVSRKINVKKGQQLETVSNSTMDISQEMMGQAMEVKSTSTATSSVQVKDVTKDSIVFANTIKRMVFNTSGMGQELSFDSDKKEDLDGQIGQQFKGKIGVPQDIVVDPQGKVLQIHGADSSMDFMTAMGGQVAKGAVYNLLTVLPGNKIKPGDSWTDSSGSVDVMKIVSNYTLKEVSGNSAVIDVVAQLAKTGKMEQMGMEVNMDLTGNVVGQAIYDVTTGLLKKNTSATKITGSMEVMGQSVPITMNIKSETNVNQAK